ncbi:hypothetical protein CK203_107939 [Vitis vinifera]|uniref:Uncharacterized protein n=1 Tax=Vitis vinifera TaxID=29760 RepID=A0A438C5U8_VITVI|nr:hypothetical protein CK203_107939 [Vitis vinifera]
MRNSMSVGKDIWKPSMLVLTMVLIHGYWGWDEPNKREVGKPKSQPNAFNAKAGMYTLNEDVDMKAKFAAMTRRLEELELKKIHEVQAVAETPVQVRDVKALITLRSGKKVELPTPKPHIEEEEEEETEKREEIKGNKKDTREGKEDHDSTMNANPEKAQLSMKTNYVPIILGRPFLATSNAIINCRNGLMQLTFGNMTLELNIFYMSKKLITPEEEEEGPEEVCIIDTLVEEHCNKKMQDKLDESLGDLEEGLP